jgi:putative redox protein
MKAKINWISNFHLEGETQTGHTITMDSKPAGTHSKGPTPKELILQSVAGCTMMDVVLIIQKSRKQLDKFWVDVDSEITAEHPKMFSKIHLIYNFIGKELDSALIERAINLSRDKYCGVYNMLKDKVDITYSYNIYDMESFIEHVVEDTEKTLTD